ncbi:hypothetical protein SNE40_020939 [Patella caerulea]|uniref:Calx-beta domain-containing protein n=1 Tax=Patella caerulea TaxID=87958 RepID=A0AAN8GCQ5_PATCE
MARFICTMDLKVFYGRTFSAAFVALIVLIQLCTAQVLLRPEDILRAKRPIEVPLGRTIYVTPGDLQISVRGEDRCTVTVLDNDPLSQRPGKLMPTIFPCDFGARDVQYAHFGSRNPSEDRIRLQIRYDSPTQTLLIPFTLSMEVSFEQLEIVTRNLPIEVNELRGVSQSIDSSVLEFTYDREVEYCKVTILSRASGLPRYGRIMNNTDMLNMVDCDDFLNMGIRYQHTWDKTSPDRDYIPMVVEVFDSDGSITKQEYFQIMARISGGEINTRPQPKVEALLVMEVDQFVMTAITDKILSATDEETNSDYLIFNITKPLGPNQGHIVSTDDRYQPVKSFYQRDVRDLRIAFKPPAQDSNSQRIFEVGIEVVDSEGLASDPFLLMIVVKPMNTMAPVVTTNRGLQLFEGQSRYLKSDLNLRISDENDLQNVRIFVDDGLRHGQLIIPGGRKFFTPKDLDEGTVIYQHDDTDTYSDNIIFKMTDGRNEVEYLFPISVYPVDDEPPILNVNTGLEIRKNELAEISPFVLSATDIDSDDSQISFDLQPPYSTEGIILKRQFEVPRDTQEWQVTNGVYEKIVQSFTQQDIMDGKIFYQHVGPHRSDFIMDRIRFKLFDGGEPPNSSDMEEFIVKVAPVDDQQPYIYPDTPLQMDVNEFQLTELKRKFLRFTDDDTDDRQLKYTITTQPFDTDPNTPLEPGTIVMCEDTQRRVRTFTQAQVNHHKICYKPPSSELGFVPRIIQMAFDVEDINGNTIGGQKFTFLIKPVNNQPPKVINGGLNVIEGQFTILTRDMLDAEDPDTDGSNINFVMDQLPTHGVIQLDEDILDVGDSFTRQHIQSGRVAYFNVRDDSGDDTFIIDVTDGVHHVPVIFDVKIDFIDDEAPTLIGIDSGTLGISLEVKENNVVRITQEKLKASDPDTDDQQLTFVLSKSPYEGAVLLNGRQTEEFSQKDVADGRVEYRHTGGEVGPVGRNDTFQLMLTDRSADFIVGGNQITEISVHVKILPEDSIAPIVSVGAPFEVLENDKAPILPIHLDATDIDTEDENIVCTIITQPIHGYVENASPGPGSEKPRTGIPVSAFSIKNVRLGQVNYAQSVHSGVEPRRDSFTFYCSDGINNSPNQQFTVNIYPENDEAPEVFLREFMVLEGMNLMVDLPILNVVDKDDPADELVFTITKFPEHGQIMQQRIQGSFPIESFTFEDIAGASTIEYVHDDTETLADSFEFFLTDGKFNITKEVPIIVIPLDDETPRLTINNGLEVEVVGETVTITNDELKAEDLDSNDPDLTFIVRQMPKYGYIQKLLGNFIYNISLSANFTQNDIDNERIQYVHTGQEGVRDLIKFDVTDGLNPLIDRYFYITVEGIDMIYPSVVNKGVELPEGGRIVLSTDLLGGTDLNTPDENLQFIVTRAPGRGHLEITDSPGVPITSFSQLDLAGNKIHYIHTSKDEMKMDSFEFEVTDGFNPVARTFRISISDVDNKKPVLMFQTLRLKEADNKLITPFELKAEDRDSPNDKIVFTITQTPIHGNLLFNNTRVVSAFTQEDLNENLITYQHDGSETTHDSFSFTVSDGAHSDFFVFPEISVTTRRPQTVNIEIKAIDNGTPQISVNSGASTLYNMGGGGLGFKITKKALRTSDRDSPDSKLKYTITSAPKYGYIINTAIGNRSINTWSQGDINQENIEYVLKTGINATSDSFFFKVSDKGKNVLTNQPFHLNWAWISLQSNEIIVNETENRLKVKLRRRGYLGETSFVTITVNNATGKVGEDVDKRYAKQVQFNPGQIVKTWRIRMLDDTIFEQKETLQLKLSDPVLAVIENPDQATITILDAEDESTVFFPEKEYRVAEDIGEILIPVKRTGDLSDELMVICSTVQGSATGTIPSTVTSYSDYITRPSDHRSIIRFDKEEAEKYCRVMIIDDSLDEEEESFSVILSEPMGGRIGEINSSKVIIEPDKNDEPAFYFGKADYMIDESDGFVEVKVWRTGTDLSKPSSVTVRSRRTEPRSAEAGLDYIAVNRILDFAPGVTMQLVRITILDDLGRPKVEGLETFQVVLRMPMAAMLGEPSTSVITINDTVSDVPSMEFKEGSYEVFENTGEIKAIVIRSGDSSKQATVRCYTRQDTAKVLDDYVERPNINASIVTFLPGELEKPCIVKLNNDTKYERDEEFRLVLGNPLSDGKPAKLGKQNLTKISVKDIGDKPLIRLEKSKYMVKEPMFKEETSILVVKVIREGDQSETCVVSVNTKDGSAESGQDYNGIYKEIVFNKNESVKEVEIEILYDGEKEMREVFTVHLRNRQGIADVKNTKAIVFIEERNKVADVTFPSRPMVVSLRDYDTAENAAERPYQGYPVVCLTPCNPKHPDFPKTGAICTSEGINDTLTLFRWRVSAPTGVDGVTSDLQDVESNTFFANTRSISLDSIYFSGGSRVQCGGRAVNVEGDPGLQLLSEPVIVSQSNGLCEPRLMGSVGAEPFTAKFRYTGPDDPTHPNKVRVAVTIPHRDGMLPVVSTNQLSNFELTLSKDGTRLALHRCSNLLDYNEIPTEFGFITNATKNPNVIGEVEPYQYSTDLRGKPTLRFYKNLNLEACVWEFVSYYDMSELVDKCGGSIDTDGQVLNMKQSYVSVRVPLYVSYVFHSPVATGGWQHYDMSSQLQLTFVYDTAILWQNGISSPEGNEGLQGYLFPTSMRIGDDNKLTVTFRTEARFRGQFVLDHPGTNMKSMVMSDRPELSFTLDLIRTEPTYEQPEQLWQFVSDASVKDYSGMYNIKLVPCTTPMDQEYSLPVTCNPRDALSFDLPIRFQQVSDPVPTRFSLNTDFHLMRKRELWLSDGSMGFGDGTDAAFTTGDKLYGRINVDPVQNLGDSFGLTIEKVFLCSGKDGYIPKYNPDNQEYGCLATSPNLQHTFKIVDKGAPYSVVETFRDIPFNAKLASEDQDALPLVLQPGADGFQIDCSPMFKVDAGRQWFLHAIYTVRSKTNTARGIRRRSVEQHAMLSTRVKRAEKDAAGIGESGKGTNLARINLDHFADDSVFEVGKNSTTTKIPLLPIVIAIAVLLLITLIIIILFVRRRRKSTSPPPSPTNTIIVATGKGSSRIVSANHYNNSNSEV